MTRHQFSLVRLGNGATHVKLGVHLGLLPGRDRHLHLNRFVVVTQKTNHQLSAFEIAHFHRGGPKRLIPGEDSRAAGDGGHRKIPARGKGRTDLCGLWVRSLHQLSGQFGHALDEPILLRRNGGLGPSNR